MLRRQMHRISHRMEWRGHPVDQEQRLDVRGPRPEEAQQPVYVQLPCPAHLAPQLVAGVQPQVPPHEAGRRAQAPPVAAHPAQDAHPAPAQVIRMLLRDRVWWEVRKPRAMQVPLPGKQVQGAEALLQQRIG